MEKSKDNSKKNEDVTSVVQIGTWSISRRFVVFLKSFSLVI